MKQVNWLLGFSVALALWVGFLAGISLGNDAIASRVLSSASVRVVATDGRSMYFGSGSYVGHRLVLTAAHVTRKSIQTYVVTRRGTRIGADVVAADQNADVALLSLESKPKIAPLKLATANPQRGERIYFAGFGGTGKFRIVKGQATQFVSSMHGPPGQWFESTYAARQGDSGGPTINAAGQLVGPLWGAGHNSTTSSTTATTRRFITQTCQSYRVPTPIRSGLRLLVGLPPVNARADWFS